jgi:hypothetical protein
MSGIEYRYRQANWVQRAMRLSAIPVLEVLPADYAG